jgi:hypothetical protein
VYEYTQQHSQIFGGMQSTPYASTQLCISVSHQADELHDGGAGAPTPCIEVTANWRQGCCCVYVAVFTLCLLAAAAAAAAAAPAGRCVRLRPRRLASSGCAWLSMMSCARSWCPATAASWSRERWVLGFHNVLWAGVFSAGSSAYGYVARWQCQTSPPPCSAVHQITGS